MLDIQAFVFVGWRSLTASHSSFYAKYYPCELTAHIDDLNYCHYYCSALLWSCENQSVHASGFISTIHTAAEGKKKRAHTKTVWEREIVTMTVRTNNRRTDRMQESLEIFTFWWWKFRNFMKMVLQFACILGYLFGSIHPEATMEAQHSYNLLQQTHRHTRAFSHSPERCCVHTNCVARERHYDVDVNNLRV